MKVHMTTMTVTDFKAHALQALNRVAQCGEPVIVTKRGKAFAAECKSGNLLAVVPVCESKPYQHVATKKMN